MGHLEVPDTLAPPGLHANEALSKETIARPVHPVVIVRRRSERQVHVAEFVVGAQHRPEVCGTSRLRGSVLPGVVTEVALVRDRVEGPKQFAGSDIKAAHVAGRHSLNKWNV